MNNIITSIDTNVPCKGNGITLGLTNGGGRTGGVVGGDGGGLWVQSGNYGSPVGSQWLGSSLTRLSEGITTDASKSGIVGTVARTQINCKYIIKY